MSLKNDKYRIHQHLLLVMVGAMFLGWFGGGEVMANNSESIGLQKISSKQWDTLKRKRIFFAHHSVGYNIIDGVEVIISKNPEIDLNIVKIDLLENMPPQGKGVFAHGAAGANFDPRSKITDFSKWVENGIGADADVAFMKFCFVDIGTRSDIQALFALYNENMAMLKERYPETLFIHMTVPLVSEKTGFSKVKHQLKGLVKGLLGKNEYYENSKKYAFNQMLRQKYQGKEPIFDLAEVESTFPDGSRLISSDPNLPIESMVPAYTYDGGHLTGLGEKIVAEKFLVFLAMLE